MKILGIIPARAGSKGIPGKNRKMLAGQTLVERAYQTAVKSGAFDRIILSTDDSVLCELAKTISLDVPFVRPKDLADDLTSMIDVVVHAVRFLAADGYHPTAVMLLQPTSPLRTVSHILNAIEMLESYDSVCSVYPLPLTECPHYVMKIDKQGNLVNFLPEGSLISRRQDVPQAYVRDGTIYLTKTPILTENHSFYGDKCRPMIMAPQESLSIDTLDDWFLAEKLLQR
jgi:N-acylneuraminate cytidylyltransferase